VRAALAVHHPEIAMEWLKSLPDADPQADVLRGQALAALGKLGSANERFERAERSSDLRARADARLSRIEASLAARKLAPSQAFDKLDAIRFSWRGDGIERRDLELAYRLAQTAHDVPRALQAGATLLRYFDMGARATPLLAEIQTMLADALAPNSSVPIASAAGIYWEYRDFAPAGADGDALAMRLADRLQAAGLPARAAELVQYQLEHRVEDVARGPLSVRVAMLHILAGHPDRALEVLRTSEDPNYTNEMRWDRKRMEAVALFQLGKPAVAEAALQDVPGAATIRAEIAWKTQNWTRLAADDANLPGPGALDSAGQTQVLRHAIALAMLNREDGLDKLRTRYGAAFQSLPSAGAFEMLTRAVSQIDPAGIEQAMAAMPSASPAGVIGDLLEVRKHK
jgi:predicted negative regulator of RcsB-dependent stress response